MDSAKVDEEDTQQRINDGDWLCVDSQCGNINFARRNSCNRCGKDRGECSKKKKLGQEIGKVAAEKSRGLFSADDWQCSKCGNVNWARRHQCNMCNAPKFGAVEERTGYGGGYNDRGVVEYKERKNDDDDDYDEFGRRKKKRKLDRSDDDSKDSRYSTSPSRSKSDNNHQDSHVIKNNYRHQQNGAKRVRIYNEDDDRNDRNDRNNRNNRRVIEDDDKDDEDEDEEGDLSKYDLSEWEDFVPAKKSTKNCYADSSDKKQRTRHSEKWRNSRSSRK